MSTGGAPERGSGLLNFALDFGPLLVFFLAYKLYGVITGTAVFMGAIGIALIVGLLKHRRVSPMTWLSAVLVIGFGGLTIYLHDEKFIQLKPTIIYAGFALLLAAGLLRGKPLLRYLFGPAFPGLTDRGWLLLSRNWAVFFAVMAALNESMRALLSFDSWLTVKVWGVPIVSFAFALSQLPLLTRHGFDAEGPKDAPVPPQ